MAATNLFVPGVAAGTSPTVTMFGNDNEGTITLVVGSSPPSSGIVGTLSLWGWSGFLTVFPKIIAWDGYNLTAANAKGAGTLYTSAFGQSANTSCPEAALQLSTTAALSAASTLIIAYWCNTY